MTYPKFKDGEATVREAKVSANYGNSKKYYENSLKSAP